MIPISPTTSRIFEHHFTSFGTHPMGAVGRGKKYDKNTLQKCILRGWKLRGLMWNQIAYQNDQRNKIYTLGDCENRTPTHFQKFCNSRKLNQNLYTSRIGIKDELVPIFWIKKIAPAKKLFRFLIPEFSLSLSLCLLRVIQTDRGKLYDPANHRNWVYDLTRS